VTDSTQRTGMGGSLVPGTYPAPEAMRPTVVGENWSVVAGHPRVSMVAAEIFAAGGNAVDAGVAAGIASNVVQVDMCNFGGIAPILVRPAGQMNCFSVAGVGRWSRTASIDKLVERYGGSLPLDGAPAIVPGAPAGWIKALEEFGTMSFADVAAPAIALARDGFLLDRRSAESLEITGRGYTRWTSSAAIYQPAGTPPVEGDRLRQPALADLLTRLAEAEGAARGSREQRIRAAHDAFYRGPVAAEIAEWVTQHGGYLTASDLAEFEAEVEIAPTVQIGDWAFSSTDSWSQGPVALEILGILSRTAGGWHEIIEATTLAFNDREDFFAAPGQIQRDIQSFLTDHYLDEQAARITNTALRGRPGGVGDMNADKSTTSIVTMDKSGCSFAASPSDTLDGGPIIPSLGILCSPRGVQSRLDPQHANALQPWGRPVVSPAALMARRDDDLWAMACPGGDVIVQAMAQVAWRMINQNVSLQEAVEAPRVAAFNSPNSFHPHPSADRFVFAEGRIPEAEIANLRKQGHTVQIWPDFEFDAGSVQTIMSLHNREGERVLSAGADPRRSAYSISI
jgi:gamma-glutamyltranspeptidase/glutathione hydrolase